MVVIATNKMLVYSGVKITLWSDQTAITKYKSTLACVGEHGDAISGYV